MFFFLASGVIASIPMALFFEESTSPLSHFLPSIEAEVLVIAVLAPLIEEFAKAYPLFYRHGESQKSLWTMGLLVGFGFGIVEFFEYVLLLGVSPWVRLPGIFFHAALTSTVAYGIAAKRSALFYLLAVFLHASVNFLAVSDGPVLIYSILLGTAYALAFIFYTKSSDRAMDY
jgi:RsiW-degrading membrane proteinase PrsW (M82 family)